MAGPRDDSLVLRSDGSNLTSTETDTVTITGGIAVVRPLAVHVTVPSQSGTTPTLKVTAQCTEDGESIEVTHTDNIDDATTFPFELILPMPPSIGEAWDVVLTVGGTSPNFGAVESWIESSELANVPAA